MARRILEKNSMRETHLEPLNLPQVERLVQLDLDLGSVGLGDNGAQLLKTHINDQPECNTDQNEE